MDNNLKTTLRKFTSLFGRNGTDIGTVNFINVDNKDEGLDAFYDLLEYDRVLTIGGALSMDILPKTDLSKNQLGWYIVKDKNGNWINDDKHWNKDWIVFARRNADAIYYNKHDFSIYGSINKKQFYKLSDSFAKFIDILNTSMILESEKYGMEISNEDEEIKPELVEDISTIVNNILDSKTSRQFVDFFFE